MNHPSIEVASELREAIGQAEIAVEAFRQAGLTDRASKLEEHLTNARKLRFSIGVVAQAKRGKSTLINGLLGRKDDILAPIDRFPATNVVSCFARDTKEGARVLFQTDDEISPSEAIPIDQIKDYACEKFNPGNRKGVKIIEVLGPFPSLSENAVLVDTPGADNALTALHDVVLMEFLPKLDAVVFLVAADAPLVASELELLKQIRRNDVRKLLFAVNKVDKVNAEDLQQGLQHDRKMLAGIGFGDSSIFEISAKAYHQTGKDPGTERLIRAIEETITKGRAGIIAERLSALTESYLEAAAAEIRAEIQNSEMTVEEIEVRCSQLDVLRRDLERNRERMATKFRAAWNAAFEEFEDELKPLQSQLVAEYTKRVECSRAQDLDSLGEMIHTDVIKRMDELMAPHLQRLGSSIDDATRELQVQVLDTMGIPARDAEQLLTSRQSLVDAISVGLAGAPSLLGATVVGALPGLVGSAILASAPATVAITWNPMTWAAAAGGFFVSGQVSMLATLVTAVIAPIAGIGAPILVGYAGLRMFSSWKHKVGRKKNELEIGVKDLIIDAIRQTRGKLKQVQAQGDACLLDFQDKMMARLGDAKQQLGELEKKRPTPERISELRVAKRLIEKVSAAKTLPDPDRNKRNNIERLFP